jgi:hypothetical protein
MGDTNTDSLPDATVTISFGFEESVINYSPSNELLDDIKLVMTVPKSDTRFLGIVIDLSRKLLLMVGSMNMDTENTSNKLNYTIKRYQKELLIHKLRLTFPGVIELPIDHANLSKSYNIFVSTTLSDFTRLIECFTP